MASAALPPPASASDALDMVLTGMRYMNAADATAMLTEEQARCLKTLEQVRAMGTAAHAAMLGAFTARQGYTEDGEYSPRSWLIHQGDITRAAAFAHTAWSRRAQEHPKIRQAMAGGILSESWARALCDITGKLPPDKVDEADALLVWPRRRNGSWRSPCCRAARTATRSWTRSARRSLAKLSTCSLARAASPPTCVADSSAPGWAGPACHSTSATARPSRPRSGPR
jgi:hypothetical protein